MRGKLRPPHLRRTRSPLFLLLACLSALLIRPLACPTTHQGLKLTLSRRPGDVINCHREDSYSLPGRPQDKEYFAGTDFIFLFKISTLSGNQNVFAIGGKYLFNGKGFVQLAGALAFVLFSETEGVKSPVRHGTGFLGSPEKAGLRTESRKKKWTGPPGDFPISSLCCRANLNRRQNGLGV